VLPGAPQIPALNNGSLQSNIGNIASLPLGDRLMLNGVQFDPDLIDSLNGGTNGNGGTTGNNGSNNRNNSNVAGVRAARSRTSMRASSYQAQQNWYLLNLGRSFVPPTNSYTAIPGFGSLFNSAPTIGAGSLGLTTWPGVNWGLSTDPSAPVAFAGFARDTSGASGDNSSGQANKSNQDLPTGPRTIDKPNADKP
jgi:hypothetical protein